MISYRRRHNKVGYLINEKANIDVHFLNADKVNNSKYAFLSINHIKSLIQSRRIRENKELRTDELDLVLEYLEENYLDKNKYHDFDYNYVIGCTSKFVINEDVYSNNNNKDIIG